jgi:exopolysaccharide biosynthesis polyprenyl glycosylphosphotransferase
MDTLQRPAIVGSIPPVPSQRSRAIREFESSRALFLLVSDLAMLGIASCAASVVVAYLGHPLVYSRVLESAVIWTFTSVWTFRYLGLYRITYALDRHDEWYYVIAGLGIGVAPLLIVFSIVPPLSSSRLVLIGAFGLSAVLVGLSRSLIQYRFKLSATRRKRRVALVAESSDLLRMANSMEDGSTTLSLIPVSGTDQAITDVLVGSARSWYDRLVEEGCDEIVFAGMPTPRTALIVERAARDHIVVAFAPAGLSSQPYGLDFLSSRRQPMMVARRVTACTPINALFKRIFDVTVASIGLLLTWPILVGAMIAILIESGTPVLYRQTRIGRNGRPFEILKLRSMVRDAEARSGAIWAVGDPSKDDRTTKVGRFIRKTSIDELPQFLNVLRGDMSIVGPRPERPVFVEQFRKEYPRYDERHLVRPGVTGWAHVYMRRSPSIDEIGERLDLDLFYIENYSLVLDIFVTFKTAVEVLFQPWA